MKPSTYTASHWGIYEIQRDAQGVPSLAPWARDTDPSPIGLHALAANNAPQRILRPAIRAGWLDRQGASREGRGKEPFVEVPWDEALDLLSGELRRVIDTHGNAAIYGGSYGWGSAGRFHGAAAHLHRFLNVQGGYVRSVDSYSLGAGSVVTPHVVASVDAVLADSDDWETLAQHTRLLVCFGGLPAKTAQTDFGGAGRHRLRDGLRRLAASGVRIVNVGPSREDIEPGIPAQWLPIRPNTDTALMLALAHGVLAEGRHDRAFLASHSVGWERFEAYLLGHADGVAKDAAWAAGITGAPREQIAELAGALGRERTLLTAMWSLQRAHHGEQPFWALVALAAVLGQIGLPGGGFAFGYGAANSVGHRSARFAGPTFPQGRNAVDAFIPVARIADMLAQPGGSFDYNGRTHRYPDIRLVYWAGGNPFHHHQDLNRLAALWRGPETVVAHEQFWNAHAKMADIVLPATTSLERDDIGFSGREAHLVAMRQVLAPAGEARDDFEIFRGLAQRLGVLAEYAEGRDAGQWLRALYEEALPRAHAVGVELPAFDVFWEQGIVDFEGTAPPRSFLQRFREDPAAHPLKTPSGKIEIWSEAIASFGYDDCPGHPSWLEPAEWLGATDAQQLHLVSDQPATKLHSQLDHSALSRGARVDEREPLTIHPEDARERGIQDGQAVRVWNTRGACVAAARLSDGVLRGVVRLATGAWFDPSAEVPGLDKHGNPNAVTSDLPASRLSQGCAAQTCLVQVEPWSGPLPAVSAFELPRFVARGG
ncbi:molybdopterin-dependent oxidoreductase [Cupriavidus basilensis]|uniref:molybdopterin-dependent oxidoreductase n=1 Tax=Cupriavidus basilensis TaxID=68895 RepID=UPI000751063D|nr:molybdopterin-dependent oxidoreductase [Cupriavidus basilensis]